MNYEKEYKKLKANIKEAYLFAQTNSTKAVLENILPELRESEDEKIRKLLIRLFKSNANEKFDDVSTQEILAWLEKQGERKPAWSEEDEHRAEDTIYFLDTAKKHYASTVELDACIDWLKSLKDKVQPQPQPKQDWSEEDEHTLQGVIDEIQANKSQAPDYDFETYDRFLSWLKSLKQRIGG